MRGKSPYNKPCVRKVDVYKLLLKLGGEARWRDIKAHLKELGWGPTTLKKVLDDMIAEGTVLKEAKLGEKGPEVWYSLAIKIGIERAIAKKLEDTLWRMPFEKLLAQIQTKLEALEEKPEEQKACFSEALPKLLRALLIEQIGGMHICLKRDPEKAWIFYSYFHDIILKEHAASILEVCVNYPEYAKETFESIIREWQGKPISAALKI
jgi:predicted transcriptional regulator